MRKNRRDKAEKYLVDRSRAEYMFEVLADLFLLFFFYFFLVFVVIECIDSVSDFVLNTNVKLKYDMIIGTILFLLKINLLE